MRYVISIVMLLCAALADAAPATEPTTQPASPGFATLSVFSIAVGVPNSKDDKAKLSNSADPGVKVGVYCHIHSGIIIDDWANPNSHMDNFADDRGTNLLDAKPQMMLDIGIGGFPTTTDDKQGYFFFIESTRPPAADATSLAMRGHILIHIADGTAEQPMSDIISLHKGAKATLAGIHYTLTDFGEKPVMGRGATVTFQSSADDALIDKLEFFSPAGKRLDTQVEMQSVGNLASRTIVFTAGIPPKVKIKATTWQHLRWVDIPIDLSTDMSLDPKLR